MEYKEFKIKIQFKIGKIYTATLSTHNTVTFSAQNMN